MVRQLPCFDLGQIEHVVDKPEQVPAVGLKAFEYAKHLLGRLAVSAVRHQFGIAEDGVERCAQLVAHVGEELRLVPSTNRASSEWSAVRVNHQSVSIAERNRCIESLT